jgi:hypothetical protein
VDTDSRSEELFQPNDIDGIYEVQREWELDALVDDLSKEWSQHDVNKRDKGSAPILGSPSDDVKDQQSKFFEVNLSPVIQPLPKSPMEDVNEQCDTFNKSLPSAPKENINSGPWSFDWLANRRTVQDDGDVFQLLAMSRILRLVI